MSYDDKNTAHPQDVYVGDISFEPEIILNRYRVLEAMGTGGFGSVCACWDTRLQRRVAIKRIPLDEGLAQAEGYLSTSLSDALKEARTACLLAHQNIVTMYDFEQDGAWAYLVMEYVDGLNLDQLLQRVEGGVLTLDEIAYLSDAVAQALAYAHENGVLHLDIKPSNILINHEGVIKLADFGIANLASAAGYDGARGGTIGYMSAEQMQGMILDERADVFSFAVVIWQALTGHNPYAARTGAEALKLLQAEPEDTLVGNIDESDDQIALELELLLRPALAPQAQNRSSDVLELADALQAYGDAKTGASSIKQLVSQVEETDDEKPAIWERRLPAQFASWTRAVTLTGRLAGAVAAIALMVAAIAPLHLSHAYLAAIGAALGVASTLWTPLSGASVAVSFVISALSNASFEAVPLGLIMALLFGAWWIVAALPNRWASAALLVPLALKQPLLAPALAVAVLPPLPAFMTVALSQLGIQFLISGFGQLEIAQVLTTFVPRIASLGFVLSTLIMNGAAWAASASRQQCEAHEKPRLGIISAQTLVALAEVAAVLVAASMENVGVFASLGARDLALAVGYCGAVCVCHLFLQRTYSAAESEV